MFTMPLGTPGSLGEQVYLDIVAYLMHANEFASRGEITTAAQARSLNGSNVGLAHAYCAPQPTGALDVDDFHKATAWLAGRSLRC